MARWDRVAHRWRLSPEEMERLPVRLVSDDDIEELACEWEFNPPEEYSPGVHLFPGEVGHDWQARYVVQPCMSEGG
jgi:hypothetical protein